MRTYWKGELKSHTTEVHQPKAEEEEANGLPSDEAIHPNWESKY